MKGQETPGEKYKELKKLNRKYQFNNVYINAPQSHLLDLMCIQPNSSQQFLQELKNSQLCFKKQAN